MAIWRGALRGVGAAGIVLLLGQVSYSSEKISFGLSWLPDGEHCGFFQAKATGLCLTLGVPAGGEITLADQTPSNRRMPSNA